MAEFIPDSELILNEDGSVFHLHIHPEDVADNVILVGAPERVDLVSSFFSKIEVEAENREFRTRTGLFNGKRVTVTSTGIGTDNIDIAVNELDAAVNIDLKSRTIKPQKRVLNLIRIGTSGALQADIEVGEPVISEMAAGFDGMLNYYRDRNLVSDLAIEAAFKKHMNWNPILTSPYFVKSSDALLKKIGFDMRKGITISAPGFYGPQGRVLRLPLQDAEINNKITAFEYNGHKITNYEMECSAIYGLGALLGHNAITVCSIIANRLNKNASSSYNGSMSKLIETVLQRLTE
ncbi:MAG: nucleoside phosphorylase [Salinivirgaceae bacterium]|nr:nucleoside phosphorylase [Salinivirgaceae bacterium]